MKTLVLGLGNPLVTDDSVGLRVIDHLRPMLADCPDIVIGEDYWGGLRLMERMIGFERVILVDALCGDGSPGTVRVLPADAGQTEHSASAHDVNLCTALELGRQAGADLPALENIRLVAVVAADVLSFGEQCTPPVEASIERAADEVLALLRQWK